MGEASRGWARLAIVAATLGAIALLLGKGSSQLLARALFDGRVATHAEARMAVAAPAPDDGCALIESHQVFDSVLALRCDDVAPPPPPPRHDDAEPATCDPSVRLVGAYVRRGDRAQSFAAITSPTGGALLYREGMRVDDHQVIDIGEREVLLAQADGERCTIAMFDRPGPPLAMLDDVVVGPVVDTRHAGTPVDGRIERISDTSFVVARSLVDEVLARQDWPTPRVMVDERDGLIVGVRVFGVVRGGLLAQLGIENGDSLSTINGHDLTDPGSALAAYARLRETDHLSLRLTRRGQPMTIEYAIR